MLEVTQQLAKFVADLRYEDIPAEVIDRAKLLIYDLVGIGVRARHEADSTLAMMRATELHRTIMNFENESVDDLFHRTVPANKFLLAGED
jgi:2-methylcitrate dehydratase PrpD